MLKSNPIPCTSTEVGMEFGLPTFRTSAVLLVWFVSPVFAFSQAAVSRNQPNPPPQNQTAPAATAVPEAGVSTQTSPQTALPPAPTPGTHNPNEPVLKQSSRIFGVVPNFTAVDSNTQLPRLTTREKFVLAMHDSVDYSSFVLVGGLSAKSLLQNSDPQLGKGAAGYGRYYWREFTDQVSGTFFTEAIIPTLTHEDPRYYTLGGHGFFKRAGYAISRVVITKNDAGNNEFNISEVGGDAAEAGLSNLYYPSDERGLSKTATNWAQQLVITGAANVLKEFWPDIRHNILRLNN